MLIVREAKVDDANQIVYINVNGWKETYKGIFPQKYLNKLDPYDSSSIKKCQDKIDEYIVAELDGKVVGMARFGKNKKGYDDVYAEIYALYVDNNFNGKKIGTKLVNFIFEKLKEKYKYVLISTLKENSANIFYKNIGGIKIGESDFILENNKYVENIYQYDI